MITSHDFKRKSLGPSEFEHHRIQRLLKDLLQNITDAHPDVTVRGSELRAQQKGWHIELYRAQPHPVYRDKGIRLPLALLKGNREGQYWKIYFRSENGHWAAYPHTDSEPNATATLRLHQVFELLESDPYGLFW